MRSYYDYYISAKLGSYDLGVKKLEYDYTDYSNIYFSLKNIPKGFYDCEITGYYIDENEKIISGYLYIPLAVTSNVKIETHDVNKYYGDSERFVVRLTESGYPLGDVNVDVIINGKTYSLKTDANGKATMSINKAPGTYKATITYADAQTTAKVTVKKATPKITAKAKTFKKSQIKKYTITLKNNIGKAMKKTKVTIKANKKTYTAKTDSKGKATFKITKLTKKRQIQSSSNL